MLFGIQKLMYGTINWDKFWKSIPRSLGFWKPEEVNKQLEPEYLLKHEFCKVYS